MKVSISKYHAGSSRKIKVEINDHDVFSLDSTLAHIILPCLCLLRGSAKGVPNEIVDNVGGEDFVPQMSFDFYTETHRESFDIACQRWDTILDKMIWSFTQLVNDESGLDPLFNSEVFDYAAYELYVERMNEGFMLFGKYYSNLWD